MDIEFEGLVRVENKYVGPAVKIWEWQNWWSFVKYIERQDNFDYVFRGHSNYASPIKGKTIIDFEPWTIISSFNRNTRAGKQYSFIESEFFKTIDEKND